MCDCIKFLSENGYIQQNILAHEEYYLYSIADGRIKKGSGALKINCCPVCGKKIGEE